MINTNLKKEYRILPEGIRLKIKLILDFHVEYFLSRAEKEILKN